MFQEKIMKSANQYISGKALSRRQFLKVGASGVALTVLAACAAPGAAPASGGQASNAPSTEGVTVKLLNANWGELYNGLMQKISDEYTTAHPNVKFEWEFVQEWET